VDGFGMGLPVGHIDEAEDFKIVRAAVVIVERTE
jgi:hypothetical protein